MSRRRQSISVQTYTSSTLILVWMICCVSAECAFVQLKNSQSSLTSTSNNVITHQWLPINSLAKFQESRSRNCLHKHNVVSQNNDAKYSKNKDCFSRTKQSNLGTVGSAKLRTLPSRIRTYYKNASKNSNKSLTQRSARGYSREGSFKDLAHSRRGVKYAIVYVLAYLALSVGAFSFILEPTWTIIDSLYFAVSTFTTVGYGDLSPTTVAAKIFTMFFSLYGISILGIALGIVGTNVAEKQERAMKDARTRASKRLMTIFDTVKADEVTFDGNNGSLTEDYLATISAMSVSSEKLNDASAKPIIKQIGSIFFSQFPVLCIIMSLAVLFGKKFEGWSTLTSIYYCWTTLATVGYGDFSPQSQPMRLFAVFFIPFSVAFAGDLIGRLATIFVTREQGRAEQRFLARELTMKDLLVMDTDKSGDVSFDEFLSFMLVAMQKVDQDTVDVLRTVFSSLDTNRSGTIMKQDLYLAAKRRREQFFPKNIARTQK